MTDLEAAINYLSHTQPAYLYLSLFFFAYLENLFPPSPSDLVIAFVGSLVGAGRLNLAVAILCATAGSTAGFATMYYVGFLIGRRIIDSGRIRFLPLGRIKTVEGWFAKYGYGLVIANRFLSGTRAIISFFTGLSELPIRIVLPLCAASALLWNTILISGGWFLGHNWKRLEMYLEIYGTVVLVLLGCTALFFILKFFLKRAHA